MQSAREVGPERLPPLLLSLRRFFVRLYTPAVPRVRAKGGKASRSRPAASRAAPAPDPVELVLYVSPLSRYAFVAQRNFEALLTRFDRRRVRFEVCDVSRHPERGDEDAICYTPMLVKRSPLPRTYVLGDLSNTEALVELLESCGVNPIR
jgi:two-component system response regulator GlrR